MHQINFVEHRLFDLVRDNDRLLGLVDVVLYCFFEMRNEKVVKAHDLFHIHIERLDYLVESIHGNLPIMLHVMAHGAILPIGDGIVVLSDQSMIHYKIAYCIHRIVIFCALLRTINISV